MKYLKVKPCLKKTAPLGFGFYRFGHVTYPTIAVFIDLGMPSDWLILV